MMSDSRIYLSPPHQSGRESALVAQALSSNWLAPVGPHLDQFEQAMAARAATRGALGAASGTAALHLALRYLRLAQGDEVFCSTLTFCASANPIVYEGARPVFIDSDAATWNMDPNLLAEELASCAKRNQLPKAIIVVDIFGQSADLDAIGEVAARYSIPVIEDAAEALGSTYRGRPVGSSAWASFFSFNGNKIITTSGGGMLCSNDSALIERARFFATQARDPAPHYEHSTIGYNYRLSNLLAAVGLAQLEVLDQRVAARRCNFEAYQQRLGQLPGVSFMPEASYGRSNRWLTVVLFDAETFGSTADDVRRALEAKNIESRPVWKPLHLQPAFAGCRARGGRVAQQLFQTGLCLPSGSSLTSHELSRVCECIEACSKQSTIRRAA
jgi:pyridoxal phosphate-dependent aminotransferase EpsN